MIVTSKTTFAPRWSRFANLPSTRFFLGILVIGVPFVLANAVSKLFMTTPELKDFRNPLKTAVLVAAYCLYVLWIERRAVFELSRPGWVRETAVGMGCGAGIVGVVVACMTLLGFYQVNGWGSGMGMLQLLQLHFFVAVLEEVLFRGVLFRLLENVFGTTVALGLSTVLFGMAHVGNPGANWVTLSCLGVFSVCLTMAFLVTRRLWIGIGMHWAWNFVQGGIFSLPISGTTVWPGVLASTSEGPEAITGGAFGIEASVVTLALLCAMSVALLRITKQRKHWVPSHWKTRKTNAKSQTTD